MWAYYFTKNKVSIFKILSTELKKPLELFEFQENLSNATSALEYHVYYHITAQNLF